MILPKISIVVPSYNKVKYIGETLQSIVDQKYPNLEVIIQDGGSTDGTLDIIKKYAKKYPKIFKWESKKDKGQTDAINKAFKKATGDIFAYVNADDVYENGALLIVGNYFFKHPDTKWLAGKGKVIDGHGKEIAKPVTSFKNFLLKLNNYNLLLSVNYFIQPSVFFKKSVFKKTSPLKGWGRIVMEYDFWLNIGRKEMPSILDSYLSCFRLEKKEGSLSLNFYNQILAEDYQIAARYTDNFVVLLLHKLSNAARIIIAKTIS